VKKKVRKFASGGDILTAAGAVLLGKHLYDKYKEGKGKSDEDSDYARKVREFNKKEAEATAVESKAEPKTVSAGEKRAMAASKGRPELIPEDADEATMRSDKYPSRKPVVTTTPKKPAPAAKK
jgi:HD superfamily phosphodiesterase